MRGLGLAPTAETNGHTVPGPTLLDSRGESAQPLLHQRSLMGRLDSKVAEQVTLTKGTLWLIASAFVVMQLVFNYGGSMIGWAREDQTQKEHITAMQGQLNETRDTVNQINSKVDKLADSITAQQIQAAKEGGYKLGLADAHAAPKEK